MKLGAMLGAFLGWKVVLLSMLVAVVAGGALAVALIATEGARRKDPIPFGPFLALGGTVGLFWGRCCTMVPRRFRRIVAGQRGLTVVELTVVVAFLAVAATGVPSLWTYLRTATLRAGAEEMAAVLNGARHLAIRMNTTVCVTNDGSRVQYHVGTCGRCRVDRPGNRRRGPHSAGEPPGGERRPQPLLQLPRGRLRHALRALTNGTLTVTAPSRGQPYRWSWPPLAA